VQKAISTQSTRYAYSNMSGSANHSRLTSVTYPNGRVVDYCYNNGLDDAISRVSYIADDSGGSPSTHLEDYDYLGAGLSCDRKSDRLNLENILRLCRV
jgi:hypothetical protein